MTAPHDRNTEASTVMTGDVHELMDLDDEGKPLQDGTEEGFTHVIETEAQGKRPELIRVGTVGFTIVDHDAQELAQSIDAIGHELPVVCLRVAFERSDEPVPMSGSLIRIAPDGAWTDVEVWFRVGLTFDDLAAPNPFAEQGQAWTRAEGVIDVLKDGEALLVQVLDIEQELA